MHQTPDNQPWSSTGHSNADASDPDRVDAALRSFWLGSPDAFEKLVDQPGESAPKVCALLADLMGHEPAVALTVADTIGAYRIVRQIGRGGMATVYEAIQERTGQQVALKLIHRSDTFDPNSQFILREVRTLALLKHPYIAALYDAGQTEEGHHFFAMELVTGLSLADYIQRYADPQFANAPPLAERLELFCKICRAMSYAHRRGVIHRDLKPTNIFIDLAGSPKILDFGLARITDPDASIVANVSQAGHIIGTLAYMSPEQARGDPADLDIRSDVYSLGMILFELLTTSRAYPASTKSWPQAVKIICEVPPRKPSTVDPRLRGDLDTIVLKSLEKDPDRRYNSATDFADDIERYLRNEPILARPANAAYQLRKLVARNKLAAALTSVLALCILGSAVLFAIQARQIAGERDAARLEADRAERMNQFLQRTLASVDPRNVGPDVRVRDTLDRAATELDADLAGRPELQASMHDTLGRSYLALRVLPSARRHLEAAYELRCRIFGKSHPKTAASLHQLGLLLNVEGKYDESEKNLRQALDLRRATFGNCHVDVAESLEDLGHHVKARGDFKAAEAFYRQSLAIRKELLGDHRDVAASLNFIGRLLVEGGRSNEAEPILLEALEMRKRMLGPQHYDVAMVLVDLGQIYQNHAQYERAEAAYREQIAILQHIFKEDRCELANAYTDLADILTLKGDLTHAEEYFRKGVETQRRAGGPKSCNLALNLNDYAAFLRDCGRSQEAEPLAREVRRIWNRSADAPHPDQGYASNTLAGILLEEGKLEEAEHFYGESISVWRRMFGNQNPALAKCLIGMGRIRQAQNKLDEAESFFGDAQEICQARLTRDHPLTFAAEVRLAELHRKRGDRDAEQMFRDTLKNIRKKPIGAQLSLAECLNSLGELLLTRNNAQAAQPLLAEALDLRTKFLVQTDPRIEATRKLLQSCQATTQPSPTSSPTGVVESHTARAR